MSQLTSAVSDRVRAGDFCTFPTNSSGRGIVVQHDHLTMYQVKAAWSAVEFAESLPALIGACQ